MGPREISLILIVISINSVGALSQVDRKLVWPSTGNFLRLNLVPEYFKGFIHSPNSIDNVDREVSEDYLDKLTPACRLHYQTWMEEIRRNYDNIIFAQNWALKMIDSWGKPPEGILSGHVEQMGDFDECLSVRGPKFNDDSSFKGKYCTNYLIFTGKIPFPINSSDDSSLSNERDIRSIRELYSLLKALSKSDRPVVPTVASCLPSSCSVRDIGIITNEILGASELTNSMQVVTGSCFTDDKPPLSSGALVMIGILVLLGVLCTKGSLIDIANRYNFYQFDKNSKLVQASLAFSVLRNTEKLLSTSTPPNTMGCLHGIRFLSALWVVLGHTFYLHILQPIWNLVDIAQAPTNSLLTLFVVNGGVVVDTFLTVTGVLVSFSILKGLETSGGKMNIPLIYLGRYLRLTPMYALLIGITATLVPYAYSGPNWNAVEIWSEYCKNNWWHNLLYVNNLDIYDDTVATSTNKQCYGTAWYLAVDMQLFLISPFVVYPLWKWERLGVGFLSLVTVASIVVPSSVTYANDLLPTALPFRESLEFTHESYMVPWMRASPYIMGIWTGYFLYITRRSFRLPKTVAVSSWIVGGCSVLAVIIGIQNYFDWRIDLPRVEGAIYAGLHHAVWGVCIGWVIFACSRGYGGWINRFLSWKVFIPLGRLTYAIFLTSFNLQFILHFSYRQPIYYSAYHAVNLSFSHLVMSTLVAFICSITLESPFMELEKMVFGKRNKPEEHTTLNNSQSRDEINYGTTNANLVGVINEYIRETN